MTFHRLHIFYSIVFIVIVSIASAAPSLADEQAEKPFRYFLTTKMGLGAEELANLAAGRILVNVLDVEDSHELVLLGVVRVDVPWEFILENLKDLAKYRFENGAVHIRRIGEPSSIADFETFELPEADIKDLQKARIGKSNVKMTEKMFNQIQSEVDWSGDYAKDVNRIVREMLVRRTNDYLEGGLGSLSPYVDKDPPQEVRDGMEFLLGRKAALFEYIPEFAEYLINFPAAELEGATDLIFCVFEDFGMKPTLSTRHISLYRAPESYQIKFTLAEINLYSSHYFQAMYSATALVESDLIDEGESSYVLFSQRFWFDNGLGGMKRRSAEGRLSGAMEDTLKRQRDRLEATYRSQK